MGSFQLSDIVPAIAIGSLSLASILSAILVFLICVVVEKILMKIIKKALSRSKLDAALKSFIATAAHAALWILIIIIVADALGIPTTSLVAVLSIAGLALSLSIQNLLANLFSGITLLITRPFSGGDLVDIGTRQGTIKSIGLFYTVIDTLDNKVVSIPNSDVTAASVVNYSAEPLRRVDMTFSASYDDETEKVRGAILQAAQADDRILAAPAPFIVLSSYGSSSIVYTVRVWCKNTDYWDVLYGMNERVRERFKANGVQMTYDHLNVHVTQ